MTVEVEPVEPGDEQLFVVPEAWWRRRRCTVCGGVLARTHTRHASDPVFTYVMQRERWWKIGKSYQPETRRKVLSMPSPGCRVVCPPEMDWSAPLVTLALIEGDQEHALHQRWAGRHAVGEWFAPDPEMYAWLEGITG